MPLFVGCLALLFPRFAVFLVWLVGGGWLGRAFEHWMWPLLGFFFLPLTTLAFAFASNNLGAPGEVTPFGWLLVVLAAATDLGMLGGGGRAAKRRRRTQKRSSDTDAG